MRRPLPPELVELGDRLEAAAAGALGRRRARRQQAFNAVASLVIAVPLAFSLGAEQISPQQTRETSLVAPASTAGIPADEYTTVPNDFLPRDWRRKRAAPNAELLVLPSSLRPALR